MNTEDGYCTEELKKYIFMRAKSILSEFTEHLCTKHLKTETVYTNMWLFSISFKVPFMA